ncbi:YaeQ family protein [Lysobacter rhizosphaerae]
MAPKATVIKAELQVTDLDRHYYASHNLILAQHPSETEERLMVRLLAFALHADERLEFGRGLSDEEEPALWRRDYTGEIEQWIELGQPDESRIRKACGRAQQVVVITYSGHGAEVWWNKNAQTLARLKNLTVIDIDADSVAAVTALYERSMRMTAMIQDGELQLMNTEHTVALRPSVRKAPSMATPV